VLFRSIYRGQLIYAVTGRLLAEDDRHIVIATVPGDGAAVPMGGRLEILDDIVAGRVRLETRPWTRSRVVWQIAVHEAHAIGTFFGESGGLKGYYVNLQEPARRTAIGVDACDHVLDIVVAPDGTWRWKDEDELEYAVQTGMFSQDEANAVRAEGERVIGQLDRLLPTGWEDWQPDPSWAPLTLPAGWDQV
jgi:hypothetical protein